jgi:hypothetical protein
MESIPVTVVCVVRHGYATTRASLENLYATTRTPFIVFYLDINSPAIVREYLAEQAASRNNFFHIPNRRICIAANSKAVGAGHDSYAIHGLH